jgi:hypothetical protein
MIGSFDIKPDFEFYTTVYHGHASEDDFDAALNDALADVEYRIWPKADLTEHITACKMAVCAVAELIANPDKRITHYSAGKTSETYDRQSFSLTSGAQVLRYLGNLRILKGGRWL